MSGSRAGRLHQESRSRGTAFSLSNHSHQVDISVLSYSTCYKAGRLHQESRSRGTAFSLSNYSHQVEISVLSEQYGLVVKTRSQGGEVQCEFLIRLALIGPVETVQMSLFGIRKSLETPNSPFAILQFIEEEKHHI